VAELQTNVTDLTYKLESQGKRKDDLIELQNELRSEKNAVRAADERAKLLQFQLDQLKEVNSRLSS